MEKDGARFRLVGDCGLLAEFGDKMDEGANGRAIALWRAVMAASIPGIVELTPSFTSLLVEFDPLRTKGPTVLRALRHLVGRMGDAAVQTGRVVEIPVCYGGAYGEDLPFVAQHAGLSEQEVIRLHSEREYLIYMIGFLPGFPYLGGMHERLFTPRLAKPRVRIPAGSVGIGGEQTGIYPMESPGGWQLIGRTPLILFEPGAQPRYRPGDRIRFLPIEESAYHELHQAEEARVSHGC